LSKAKCGKNVGKLTNLEIMETYKNPEALEASGFIGTPSGARTLDTLIKSQVLCQLS
jgi:hypothetical protein